jgi:hypothetical protein
MPSEWSQEKYVAALKYAAAAHLGQKVPGSDLPYVVHVVMVAMEVIAVLRVEDGIDGDLAVQAPCCMTLSRMSETHMRTVRRSLGRRSLKAYWL